MKRHFFLLVLLVVLSITVRSQVKLSEGFENGIPATWKVIDVDRNNCIGYESLWQRDNWDKHNGSYCASVWSSWCTPFDNDWLITPQVVVSKGDVLSFWVRSDDTFGTLENFNVKISKTGTLVGNFTITLASVTNAPSVWTRYSYVLTDKAGINAGDAIYIAIQYYDKDKSVIYLDDFMVATPFKDAEVSNIFTYGKVVAKNIGQHQIQALISNTGTEPFSSLGVSLTVNGANMFTDKKYIDIVSGEKKVVTFNSFTPIFIGGNNITVDIDADEKSDNNSKKFLQQVTENTFSYADTTSSISRSGFNTSPFTGIISARFHAGGVVEIMAVKNFVASKTCVGNEIYAVVMDTQQIIVAQSVPITITEEHLNTYVNFPLPTPVYVSNADFYVGIAQTIYKTDVFGPYSYQEEPNPSYRTNAFYISPIDASYTNPFYYGRFLIEAVAEPVKNMAPALQADATQNTSDNDIDITFTADANWQSAINKLFINNTLVNENTLYTIQAGKITLSESLFDTGGIYTFSIYAEGYTKAEVVQTVTQGLYNAPSIASDISENDTNHHIEFTFETDVAWQQAITDIYIAINKVDKSLYKITDGKIQLDVSLFPIEAIYPINIVATGYKTLNIHQIIYLANPYASLWDKRFVLPINGEVLDMVELNNNIYIIGTFTEIDGKTIRRAAVYSNGKWQSLGMGLEFILVGNPKITVFQNELYITDVLTAYNFDNAIQPFHHAVKWNGKKWTEIGIETTDIKINSISHFATSYSTELLVCGDFTSKKTNRDTIGHIAKVNGKIWNGLNNQYFDNSLPNLISISSKQNLYAAWVYKMGDIYRDTIAVWNGVYWKGITLNMEINMDSINQIKSMEIIDTYPNEQLFVGGLFSNINSVRCNNLAVWDGTNWSAVSNGQLGEVVALSKNSLNLIVGSNQTYGYQTNSSVDVYLSLSDTWENIASINGRVNCLFNSPSNNKIHIGGVFDLVLSTVNAYNTENIISIDMGNHNCQLYMNSSKSRGSVNNTITDIEILDNKVYATGSFAMAGNSFVNGAATWDNSTWQALDLPFSYISQIRKNNSFFCVNGKQTIFYPDWFLKENEEWKQVRNITATGITQDEFIKDVVCYNDYLYVAVVSLQQLRIIYLYKNQWHTINPPLPNESYESLLITESNGKHTIFVRTSTGLYYLNNGVWENLIPSRVFTAKVIDNKLYVGGTFSLTNKQLIKIEHLAVFDGADLQPVIDEQTMRQKLVFRIAGNQKYLFFSTSGDIYRWDFKNLIKIEDKRAGVGIEIISDMEVMGNSLYVGGDFSQKGGKTSMYFGYWNPVEIQADAEPVICADQSLRLYLEKESTYEKYQWRLNDANINGATDYQLYATFSGKYTAEITFTDGSRVESQPFELVVNPIPEKPVATTDDSKLTYCTGNNIDLKTNALDQSYRWMLEDKTLATSSTTSWKTESAGIFSFELQVENQFQCTNISNPLHIEVKQTPIQPQISTYAALSVVCDKTPVELRWLIANDSYIWKVDNTVLVQTTNNYYNATEKGDYSLIVVKDNCPSPESPTMKIDKVVFDAFAQIQHSSTGTNFCKGETVKLQIPANNGFTYQWSGKDVEGTSETFCNITDEGLYKVKISSKGCEKELQTELTFRRPIAEKPVINTTNNKKNICGNEAFSLFVADNYDNYVWRQNGNILSGIQNSISILQGGDYTLQTRINDCSSPESDMVSIVKEDYPNVSQINTSTGGDEFCSGESITLSVSEGYTYLWEGTNNTTAQLQVTNPETYYVTVSNSGCSVKLNRKVSYFQPVLQSPVVKAIKGSDGYILVCKEPIGNYDFMWYEDGQAAPEVSGNTTKNNERVYETKQPGTEYYVMVTDANNCSIESEPLIISNKKSLSVYPNPNKGTFTIKLSGLTEPTGQTALSGQTDNRFTLKDILGREIYIEVIRSDGNSLEISIPNAKTGIYLLEVIDSEGERFVKKVFVE